MDIIFWTLGAFLAGSIPFSLLIGRYALGQDIRRVGDGNPGATNVGKAGGAKWGVLAFVADFLKAAIPVGLAYYGAGITDGGIIPIGIAPIAGHAFSPWLGFKGGKALAATFGIWSALTLAEVPMVLGFIMLLLFMVLTVDGWAVVLALASVGVYLGVIRPDAALWGVWLGNFLIVAYKHRAELAQPLRLKPVLSALR